MNANTTQQIEISKLTITKPDYPNDPIDLMNIMEEFIIHEDLMQSSLSAKLVLKDQINLVGVLPIIGGERITFKYKTPIYSEYNEVDFIVYKVGERPVSNDTSNIQVSTLFLCTPEMWWAVNNDVSLGIRGSYDEIINKLIKLVPNSTKNYETEKAIGVYTYTVPNINIFRAISFCSTRAFSEQSSPFLFWETPKGYLFKSIRTLYDTAAVKSLYVGDRSMYGQDDDPEKLFNTVHTYEYLESNDRLRQNNSKDFGGKFFLLDISTASLDVRNYDYSTSFDKNPIHLEGFQLNDDTKSIRNKTGIINNNPDGSHEIEWLRNSTIDLMRNVRFLVSIPGDSELKTGDTVWFDVPSKIGHENDSEKLTSGKFVVTSIKHLIQKETYTQVLEINKDSFAVQARQNEVK